MGTFIEELERETKAAAHDALVDTFMWANRQTYGSVNADLRARAETWAQDIEDRGLTMEVLAALSSDDT